MALTRLGPNNSSSISGINLTSQVTGTLPTGNGGTGATSFSPGKVGQVLSTLRTAETRTSSSSWTATGHSVTMTPVATSSKILIIFNMSDGYVNSGNYNLEVRPYSSIGGATAAQASAQTLLRIRYNVWTGGGGYNFLYSPSTTSSVQIENYFKANGTGTVYYHNETSKGTSLTLMEILA